MPTARSADPHPEYNHFRQGDEFLAWRDTGGPGKPVVLFVHGFASFSWTWEGLLRFLPEEFRLVRVDLAGFGFSLGNSAHPLSPYDQAALLERLIGTLELRRITLVGHGCGGEVCMLLSRSPDVLARLDRMCLIACRAPGEAVPDYISKIASLSLTGGGRVLEFARSRFLARILLEYVYGRKGPIRAETLDAYSAMLRHPGRLDSIIRAAGEYAGNAGDELLQEAFARFELPTLLLFGEKDPVISRESRRLLSELLRNAREIVIPGCGHLPQEERPETVAELLCAFLHRREPRLRIDSPSQQREKEGAEKEKEKRSLPRLSRLFDRWSPGTLLMIFCLKVLQFFRSLGVRAEAHGWRKLTTVFLRGEYSKFMLASFRLDYCGASVPKSREEARKVLLRKLYAFQLLHQNLHWSVEPGIFSFGRRRLSFCDLVEAHVDSGGALLALHPQFDQRSSPLQNLTEEQAEEALEAIIRICNSYRETDSRSRPGLIASALRRRLARSRRFHLLTRRSLQRFTERVMAGTFLFVEVLPEGEENGAMRFRTPDLRIYRHPGWGMTCVTARFTADFREVDLWFQFHHTTADGAPMQELLVDLKRLWGAVGPVVYPAFPGVISRPETLDCGDGVFRSRIYVDFSFLLRLRKYLNDHYTSAMHGSASLAGLLMWGLAHHPFFREKKMLLPIDAGISPEGERELGLLFIRPGAFFSETEPLRGFLRFQKEMNRRMNNARNGSGESHEFLSLCTMLHPFFYHLARLLAPSSLDEIVGTMGISIIRDAEMFISPLTDFQKNGFVTLGSVKIPTADGSCAGSLCICGSRAQIRIYLQAVKHLVRHFPEMLGLPEKRF